MAKMVEACAGQLMQIMDSFETMADAYIIGILKKAGHPVRNGGEHYWMDIPDTLLRSVFQMLDTHRRRLLKAASFPGPLTFSVNAAYLRSPLGAITASSAPPKPSAFKVNPLKQHRHPHETSKR